ncbi:hypothetical protein BOTBODRAFT_29530 [Botryobasidium botryosum FD-172 SS1]|uniref:C2H2-type domain-containing protein n=1 Tax=Botryobasidium botryosum (strain FD-172 SS1) TaxID=930990 RepID=A0A067MRG5_BOTB1|nr:hypothetical protein BOTBODRAFT_29530 [Botryobasidium botryosum FD-172 SS1]
MCLMFKCGTCPKSFKRHSHLSRHINDIHTKKRRFECPEPGCAHFSTQKQNLDAHVQTHEKRRLRKSGGTHSPSGPSPRSEADATQSASTPSLLPAFAGMSLNSVPSSPPPPTSRSLTPPSYHLLPNVRDPFLTNYPGGARSPTPSGDSHGTMTRVSVTHNSDSVLHARLSAEAEASILFIPQPVPTSARSSYPDAHAASSQIALMEKARMGLAPSDLSISPPPFHQYLGRELPPPSDAALDAAEGPGACESHYGEMPMVYQPMPTHPSEDSHNARPTAYHPSPPYTGALQQAYPHEMSWYPLHSAALHSAAAFDFAPYDSGAS